MPFLLITIGYTGVGKSTLAQALAHCLKCPLLRSDEYRKRLAGLDVFDKRRVPFGHDIYTPQMTERTYQALFADARRYLQEGQGVILDASFLEPRHRKAAWDLARHTKVMFLGLLCVLESEDLLKQRLWRREAEGRAISDGRWEIYQIQKTRFPLPPAELPAEHLLVLDMRLPIPSLVQRVLDRLKVSLAHLGTFTDL